MIKSVTFVFLFFYCLIAIAQKDKYIWNDYPCRYIGIFDSKKVTKEQIHNSILITDGVFWTLKSEDLPRKPSDLEKINIDSLDTEYQIRKKEIEMMPLPNSSFWEEIRKYNLDHLKEVYEYFRIVLQAYKDPIILKQYGVTDSCFYFNVLINKNDDQILNAWANLAESQFKQSSPTYKELYLDKLNTPDKLIYAKIQLLDFGIIRECRIPKYPLRECKNYNKTGDEFKNLFIKIKTKRIG